MRGLRLLALLSALATITPCARADLIGNAQWGTQFRRWAPDGTLVDTFSGSDETCGGLGVDANCVLYFGGNTLGYGQIYRYNAATRVTEALIHPTSDQDTLLTQPTAFTFDSAGRLYVGSTAMGSPGTIGRTGILRYDPLTSILSVFATPPPRTGYTDIEQVGFTPDGFLYAQQYTTTGRIWPIFDPDTGGYVGRLLAAPFVGTPGPDGKSYAFSATQGICRYESDGTFLNVFVPLGSGGMSNVKDLTFGDGYLYVLGSDSIRRYNETTGVYVDVFQTWTTGADQISEIQAITVPEPAAISIFATALLLLAQRRTPGRSIT